MQNVRALPTWNMARLEVVGRTVAISDGAVDNTPGVFFGNKWADVESLAASKAPKDVTMRDVVEVIEAAIANLDEYQPIAMQETIMGVQPPSLSKTSSLNISYLSTVPNLVGRDKSATALSWSFAVKVATAVVPSSTGKVVALVISGATAWRVKVRLAIGSSENFPVPLMLVMVPRGEVAEFDRENSVPSSVPASQGNRSIVRDGCQPSSAAVRRDSPETPTNQSGLGATIEVRVTGGWSVVSVMSTVAVAVPSDAMDCSMTARAFGMAALISDLRVLVPPISAILSIPALAVPPLLQKVTLPLCTAPIKVVKCAPDGTDTPPARALAVNLPSNVTR